jgi:hypothetical protein
MRKVEKIKAEMNRLGSRGIPFAFLIDFEAKHSQILKAGKTEENIF